MMEIDARLSSRNEKRPLDNSIPVNKPKFPVGNHKNVSVQNYPVENHKNVPVFVNHAAIAWAESRRRWTGDLSQKHKRIPKDPVISWSMAYEDLLSTNDPFPERIPLPEMVDFLVDIWQDEGHFD